MRTVPLDPVPNQSLTVTLGGHRWELRLKYARGSMVADLTRDGVVLVQGHRLAAGSPFPPYPYQQTGGMFWLVTDGEAEPDYARFGVDQSLVYVAPGEL